MNSKSLAYCNETSGINISVLLNILRDEKLQSQIIYEIENLFSPYLNNQKIGHKEKFMITDLHNYLPDDVLSLLDKTTMMNSLEGRVPYLDHRIVEHVFSNNSEIFDEKKALNAKSVLKRIFKTEIPENILNKKKVGFNAPLNEWFVENFTFFKKNFSNHNFYDQFFKKDFYSNDFLSKKDSAGLLFSLSMFDEWYKNNNER